MAIKKEQIGANWMTEQGGTRMNRPAKGLILFAFLAGPGGFLLGQTVKSWSQPEVPNASPQFAKRQDGQITTLRAYGWGLQGYGNMLLEMDDARSGQKVLPLRHDDERRLEELAHDLTVIADFATDVVLMDGAAKKAGK